MRSSLVVINGPIDSRARRSRSTLAWLWVVSVAVLLGLLPASHSQAAVDIAAQEAFLRTAPGGGDEVTTPAVGQTVYFHVGFQLTGPAGSVAVSQRALLDGAEFCAFTEDTTPGDWFSWCLDGWTATAGTHTLQWDLDYTNTVAETNENNNSVSTTWTSGGPTSTPTPGSGVDIAAQRAFLRTAPGGGDEVTTPAVGQTVYFHVGFQLTGATGSLAISGRARLDGGDFCTFTSDITTGTWTAWCTGGWTATAGTHTLQWDLDYTNQVAETNENNNSAATTWTSGGPTCVGDCNHSGEVTVGELVTMVNIALGSAALSACPAGDADGSGTIEINEIIAAVNNALDGCP